MPERVTTVRPWDDVANINDSWGQPVATAARRGVNSVARIIRFVGLLIVAILVLHIILSLVGDPNHPIVVVIRDLAGTLNLGIANLFQTADPRWTLALNYGAAALLWYVITVILTRIVDRMG